MSSTCNRKCQTPKDEYRDLPSCFLSSLEYGQHFQFHQFYFTGENKKGKTLKEGAIGVCVFGTMNVTSNHKNCKNCECDL